MDTTFYADSRRHKPSQREPLASQASHKRLPQWLLHFFKQKFPNDLETLASKRSSSTPSHSSDSSGDGVVIYSDTEYPRIDEDHQEVILDSEPAILRFRDRILQRLKLELDLYSNDGHKAHGSGQKRHADNPNQGSRDEKKQKQGQGSRNTRDGGGGGKKNDGGNGGKQPPDGHRYPVPPPDSGPQKNPPFACPFHKFDPVRYAGCSKVRLKRLSDVSQHIERRHVLKEVKQKTASADNDAEAADDVEFVGDAGAEEQVTLYCPKCRMQFFGTTAEANLRQHLPCQERQPATIEQTGVLLPAEFDQLTAARTKASGNIPKWNAMWKTCFPNRPVPKSPYFALPGQEAVTVLPEVQVETPVPRLQAGQIIRRVLNDRLSHLIFIEGEIDTIVDQALNGIYPGGPQTSTDTRLEVQQRQNPQWQMSQQQISQQPFNGAATSSAFDPSAVPADPQAYPLSHQLYQNPSAPAPFALTPQVAPQTVPQPGPLSNAQTPQSYYGAPFIDPTALTLPPQHSPQMSPPAADVGTGPPVAFRSAPGPVAPETSPASFNSSLYGRGLGGTGFSVPNQNGADVSGFPPLEFNGFPTNNDLNDNSFPWRSDNGYQDPNWRYGL